MCYFEKIIYLLFFGVNCVYKCEIVVNNVSIIVEIFLCWCVFILIVFLFLESYELIYNNRIVFY